MSAMLRRFSVATALLLMLVALPALAGGKKYGHKDIVETAAAHGQFNTLVTAIESAGLAQTLQGDQPYTVFAPTDAAFAKLPEGTVAELLKPENRDKLRAVLLHHVVPGRVMAAKAMTLNAADTAGGTRLVLRMADGQLHVGEAMVTDADLTARNGVIHVIDTVLMPPEA